MMKLGICYSLVVCLKNNSNPPLLISTTVILYIEQIGRPIFGNDSESNQISYDTWWLVILTTLKRARHTIMNMQII